MLRCVRVDWRIRVSRRDTKCKVDLTQRFLNGVGLAGGTVGLFDSSRVSSLEQLVIESSGADQWTPPIDPDHVCVLTAGSLANAAADRVDDESLDALYSLDHSESDDAHMCIARLCVEAADRHGIEVEALAAGVREFLTGGWDCSQFYTGRSMRRGTARIRSCGS